MIRIAAAAAQAAQPEIHLQPSPDTPYAFVAGVLVIFTASALAVCLDLWQRRAQRSSFRETARYSACH